MKHTNKKPSNEATTARVVLLMTPTEKAGLFARAKADGYDSVSAYVRRHVLGAPAEGPASQEQATALARRIERIERHLGIERKTEHDNG